MATAGGDPGWGHALRTGWKDLLVPFPLYPLWRSERLGRDSLTTLRIGFLCAFVAEVVVVSITWFLVPEDLGADAGSLSPSTALALVVGVGALGLVALATLKRRTPAADEDVESVAGWFRTICLLGLSMSQVPFLLGFVFAFVANENALVLAGIPLSAVGFWTSAPTRRRLDAAQEQLARACR
jgi:hypothetical protein